MGEDHLVRMSIYIVRKEHVHAGGCRVQPDKIFGLFDQTCGEVSVKDLAVGDPFFHLFGRMEIADRIRLFARAKQQGIAARHRIFDMSSAMG